MIERNVFLEELMVHGQSSIDPRNSPDEEFELFSIPAYDKREPEQVFGREVGSSKKIVASGDLLLSRIVPHIRRAWVVPPPNGKRQIASGEWIVFRHNSFEPRYLRHLVMGDSFHSKFMNTVAGVGGSLVRARPENVGRIEIPLPPLSEQKRIADILDKADSIRRKRQEADALLTSVRSAVFHERFGDPVANPKSWEVVKLGELFERSPSYGTMIKPSDEVRGWLDLRVANIQGGKLDLSSRKYVDLPEEKIEQHEVREGDLLLARAIGSVEHLGKCIIADPEDQKWAFDSHLMRIRFDATRVLPRFVHAFLESPGGRHEFLRNSRRSAVQFNINTKEMACIRIPLPPLIDQQRFIGELDLLDQLSKRQNSASQENESLFNSLVHRAFTGER
jgi:type I restriction enzyme S subunit